MGTTFEATDGQPVLPPGPERQVEARTLNIQSGSTTTTEIRPVINRSTTQIAASRRPGAGGPLARRSPLQYGRRVPEITHHFEGKVMGWTKLIEMFYGPDHTYV